MGWFLYIPHYDIATPLTFTMRGEHILMNQNLYSFGVREDTFKVFNQTPAVEICTQIEGGMIEH